MKLAFVILAFVLSACSHGAKQTDSSPVAKPVPRDLSQDDVLQKYSLLQLNAAATALRAISDEAKKPSEDKGSDILGCSLTGAQAGKMMMPIKALIDADMRSEVDSYVTDPKNYATEKGFEACAPSCACGVLSDVVTAADDRTIPPSASKLHARAKTNLQRKASAQSGRDSLACARRASWFCGSDLKAYLEKDAR